MSVNRPITMTEKIVLVNELERYVQLFELLYSAIEGRSASDRDKILSSVVHNKDITSLPAVVRGAILSSMRLPAHGVEGTLSYLDQIRTSYVNEITHVESLPIKLHTSQ